MSHKQFQVSDRNPNGTTGGGGCVCDPEHQSDCKPPFAIFYGNDMESIVSPHVVICQSCAAAVVKAMTGEILHVGEPNEEPEMTANFGSLEDRMRARASRVVSSGEGEIPNV